MLEWGIRRKVQYTSETNPVAVPRDQPPRKKRSTRKKPDKEAVAKVRNPDRQSLAKRWSLERYQAAETKLVEILRWIGAGVGGTPVARQVVRGEARKHIRDTGLLDHLLKHMVGKVVANGSERLRRCYNAEGAMEYWLEPAELAEVRCKVGVVDPFWVPPLPRWNIGDASVWCPCRGDCEEVVKLREEVKALKRDYQRLLQWKSNMEEEMSSISSWLQKLNGEMTLMRNKFKKPKFAGSCHSANLHIVSAKRPTRRSWRKNKQG